MYWNKFKRKCDWHSYKRPKVVAVDLDGTILEYSGWKGQKHFGKPIDGAKEALQKLKDEGYVIVIWTTRRNTADIAKVLNMYGIPFDYINENPYQPPDCSNKIYADVYVDDRAVGFRGDWSKALLEVRSVVE